MINQSKTWQLVKEKQEELRALVDENWNNKEYILATVGERTLRTVDSSLDSSERMIHLTNHFIDSIDKLEKYLK
jgi:hypothetical protein